MTSKVYLSRLSEEKTRQLLNKLLEDLKEVECIQQKDLLQLSLCSGKKAAAHRALLQSKSTDRGSGGLGAKTGLFLASVSNKTGLEIRDESVCIDANYYKGLGANQQRTAVLHSHLPCAVLTPNRIQKRQNGRRFKNEDEEMFTLTSSEIHGIIQNSRIRRLTPLETFRLQGVPDEYFYRAASVCSDAQLYKQAGNAVTVPVVRAIGERLMEIIKSEEGIL